MFLSFWLNLFYLIISNSTFSEEKTLISALWEIYSLNMMLKLICSPKSLMVSCFFDSNSKYNNWVDAVWFNIGDFATTSIRLEGGNILKFRIVCTMYIDISSNTAIMNTEGTLLISSTECCNSADNPMKSYRDVAST